MFPSITNWFKEKTSAFVLAILFANCYVLFLALDIRIKYGIVSFAVTLICSFISLSFIFYSIGKKIGGESYAQICPSFPAIIILLVNLLIANAHDFLMGTIMMIVYFLLGLIYQAMEK